MLQQPQMTPELLAAQTAGQVIKSINDLAANVVNLRKDGIPAVPAREASQTPDGRTIPAFVGRPAVTGEQMDTAFGTENVALLTAIATALGL